MIPGRIGRTGVYRAGRNIYTLAPEGDTAPVYGEKVLNTPGGTYRRWNPKRSKLSAAIHVGLDASCLRPGSEVVYLGAADGTTVSHVLDAVGDTGRVMAVEFSPYPFGHLMALAQRRKNLLPVLGDARTPKRYIHLVSSKTDLLFQDVSQRDQLGIFLKNVNIFLKRGGVGLLVIKARSVDVAGSPARIFDEVEEKLVSTFSVKRYDISRFEKDHVVFRVERR